MVSSILNSCPLSVRSTPDGDYIAISPKDILLGRAGKSLQRLDSEVARLADFDDNQNLSQVEEVQAKIVAAWREKWLAQVFLDMIPRHKWKTSHRDLQVGDVGVLKYEKKFGPEAWRLARIIKAEPDSDGHVQVAFRPRHVKDNSKPYKTKPPITMDIGVQRFAVMLLVEEQGQCQEDDDCQEQPLSCPKKTLN